MPALAPPLTVSVLICAYTERRWPLLSAAIDSLRSQRRRPDETVLVIDHNASLLARAAEPFPDVQVVRNVEAQGLSGSRNTGVHHSRGDVFVFLDDDAVADVDWLSSLIEPFDDPLVLGTGASRRRSGRHRGCSGFHLSSCGRWAPAGLACPSSVRGCAIPWVEPWPSGARPSCASAVFRTASDASATLTRGVKRPSGLSGCSRRCRIATFCTSRRRASSTTPADRATWRYFLSRCWSEGRSKAVVTDLVGRTDGLASERSYVSRVLPRGHHRYARRAAR